MITPEQFVRLAPQSLLVYRKAFANAGVLLEQHGITTPLRLAHFLAQLAHESGGFRIVEESLNYSVEGLLATFGRRVPREVAAEIGRAPGRPADQLRIAEAIYGGKWGAKNLGNTEPGDGYRFRGRGPIQLTGRANYAAIGGKLGVDLVGDPDLVKSPAYVLAIPCLYWTERKINAAADRDDLRAVTKAINGGTIGLCDRADWLERAKGVLS